jgi:hypothetical protein
MPRAKIYGYIAVIVAALLGCAFVYYAFIHYDMYASVHFDSIDTGAYWAVVLPIALVTLFVLATGFWVGYTILTIKVAPPMPEIIEKKDNSKFKAFLLCLVTIALAVWFCIWVIPSFVFSHCYSGCMYHACYTWHGLLGWYCHNYYTINFKEQ